VTEIPEHLLKRSQQRREAMGLGGGASSGGEGADPGSGAGEPAAASEPSSAVAQPAAAAAPAGRAARVPAKPPPAAPPDPPYVLAAKQRRRVPFWAMPVLAVLPVWAFMYWSAVKPPPADQNDPLIVGAQVYTANCAQCHGNTGEGGSGPQLSGGSVLKTFKKAEDQARWVNFGKAKGVDANGNYGDPDRPGGQRNDSQFGGAMPTFEGTLTPDQIAAVVRHERETLSGEKPVAGQELTGDKVTAYIKAHPAGG